MKNAILSSLRSYSYTNNGCSEALPDTPSQISSNMIAHDNSSCIYGNFSNGHGQFGAQHTMNTQPHCSIFVSGSTSTMPKQNLEDTSQGETHLTFMPVQDDTFYQPWKSVSDQHSNNELQLIRTARKRSLEASDTIQKTSSSTCGLIDSASNEETGNRKRAMRFQEKLPKIQKEKEPTMRRRSQKLTDKITALQKLVSPYGKTDTASVLLEASVSIKALQDHIKDLFHMISGQPTTMTGEKGSDLQSRGLCLVSCVILKELDRRYPIHCLQQ